MFGTSQQKKAQRWSTMERRVVDMAAGLDQVLTIRPRPLEMTSARLPHVHRHLWYYEARFQSGDLAATLHIGEGIVVPGGPDLWRVDHRDGVSVLHGPDGPEATYFVGHAGMFVPKKRLTLGAERFGGYEVEGRGWNGGWVIEASTNRRVLSIFGEAGDLATVYHVAPTETGTRVPLAAVMLLSYVLTDREVRAGCWIPRPHAAVA